MMYHLILVGLGGAVGSMLRYLCQRQFNHHFPYGTLLVNIIGCLIIGLLWGFLSKNADEEKRLLLATGFCGGLTTFSAFSQEGIQLMMESRWLTFAVYTMASVLAGFAATYIGFKLTNA